jgi:ribonucleoside-triphosphate reductase (thioredoxin)
MFVKERFHIASETIGTLRSLKSSFGFNGLGEVTYYRTYSRTKPDGSQEHWVDTIVRVVEGLLSIRKDHYAKNGLPWDEEHWQEFAREIGLSMFHMEY